ncbi:uncharacterized protein LOC111544315 isoform X1 [Piliocolobus tephrosceles]|uniref:uncharacterized protein LOC111544315 isoform X1 n=1 Tax=Piliocolobus tephrosceles TaxID=591936 RepID=UPI000C29D85A|nr:uncharacterized protein LOC111544315 isoform X1 [Piliocolobus tephrosceles]
MSALESPRLLLPLEKPTDRRAAHPAVAPPVQAESAGDGRAAATHLPAKEPWARRGRDRFPPQREPTLPQVDVDFKPAERRAHFHCLKPPRVRTYEAKTKEEGRTRSVTDLGMVSEHMSFSGRREGLMNEPECTFYNIYTGNGSWMQISLPCLLRTF